MTEDDKKVLRLITFLICLMVCIMSLVVSLNYFFQNSGYSTYAVEFVDGKVNDVWGDNYGSNVSFTRKLGSKIIYVPIQGEVKKCFINATAADGKKAKVNACLSYQIPSAEGIKAFYKQKGITPDTNIHEYFRGRMELELESAVIAEIKKEKADVVSGKARPRNTQGYLVLDEILLRLSKDLRGVYTFEQKNETADCCQKYISYSKESLISLNYVRTYVNWEN